MTLSLCIRREGTQMKKNLYRRNIQIKTNSSRNLNWRKSGKEEILYTKIVPKLVEFLWSKLNRINPTMLGLNYLFWIQLEKNINKSVAQLLYFPTWAKRGKLKDFKTFFYTCYTFFFLLAITCALKFSRYIYLFFFSIKIV